MLRKTGKQLDKLSQWTGEKFFSENKTALSSEFREFEKDAEARRILVERLHATSVPYHSSLSKSKPTADPYPSDPSYAKDKVSPGEALGTTMISCGEDIHRAWSGAGFGTETRRYGEMLEKLGRGRVKVAVAQEEFATQLEQSYMAGTAMALDTAKEYQSARKKLDSRRLALDAATRKMNGSKKESRALEEEVEKAQERFEEIQQEVEARIGTVQEGEAQQMLDLESFLEAELEFVQKYHEILMALKNDWGSGPSSSANRPRAKSTSAVTKVTVERATPPSRLLSRPALPTRQSSARVASSDEEKQPTPSKSSRNRDRSESNVSAGKKEKTGLAGAFGALGRKRAESSASKRFGGGKTDKYGSLDDDEAGLRGYEREEDPYLGERPSFEEDPVDLYDPPAPAFMNRARSHSSGSTSGSVRTGPAPAAAPVIQRRETQPKPNRRVKVIFDYSATAPDELTLDIGDNITVTKEVSPDWWIGDNEDGESGLFPSSYTRPIEDRVGDQSETEMLTEEEADTPSALPPPLPAAARPRNLPPAFGSPLKPGKPVTRTVAPTPPSLSTSVPRTSYLDSQPGSTSPVKRAPPIPPPMSRRNTNNTSRLGDFGSPGGSPKASPFEAPAGVQRMLLPPQAAMGRSRSGSATAIRGTGSPFGGSDEEDGTAPPVAGCTTCACDDFTQNVFKPQGTCSSCFHQH